MKIFSFDANSDKIYILVNIFGKTFKYRKTGYSYIIKNKYWDFIFWFLRLFIKKNYHIIPMGTYCFSRTATTFNKLKRRRNQGEKSCPFDLALYDNFDSILNLLDTEFKDFYKDICFNKERKSWMSKTLSVEMGPESMLIELPEFKARYDKRIKNLYDYFADKKAHKYVLVATKLTILPEQIERLFSILQRYMNSDEFDVILLNQSDRENNYKKEHLYVINHDKFFKEYNTIYMNWAGEIKTRRSPSAQKIYNDFTLKMMKILSKRR